MDDLLVYKDKYSNIIYFLGEDEKVYLYVGATFKNFTTNRHNSYVWTGVMLEDLNKPKYKAAYDIYKYFKRAKGETLNTPPNNGKVIKDAVFYLQYDHNQNGPATYKIDKFDNIWKVVNSDPNNLQLYTSISDLDKKFYKVGISNSNIDIYDRVLYYTAISRDRSSASDADGQYMASYTVDAYLATDDRKQNIKVFPIVGQPLVTGNKQKAFVQRGGTPENPTITYEIMEVIVTGNDPQAGMITLDPDNNIYSDDYDIDGAPYINVVPNSLNIRVGERRKILIESNLKNIVQEVDESSKELIEYDSRFTKVHSASG